MNTFKRNNGEVLTISIIFIAIAVTIFMFILAIFMSHINTILYNYRFHAPNSFNCISISI